MQSYLPLLATQVAALVGLASCLGLPMVSAWLDAGTRAQA